MNITFIFMFFSSVLLSSNIYLGVDMSYDLKGEVSGSNGIFDISDLISDPDDNAITFGYNHALSPTLDLGFSYMVSPMIWDAKWISGDYVNEQKAGFASIYLKPKFNLSKDVDFWFDIGVNFPTEGIKDSDFDDGMLYGAGLNFSLKEKVGIAFGYNINTTSKEQGGTEVEYEVGRATLYLTYDVD